MTIGSKGGMVGCPLAANEPSIATGVVKPAIGLGVGDRGWRLGPDPNEGDLGGSSVGLLPYEGVAVEYWSLVLIC